MKFRVELSVDNIYHLKNILDEERKAMVEWLGAEENTSEDLDHIHERIDNIDQIIRAIATVEEPDYGFA